MIGQVVPIGVAAILAIILAEADDPYVHEDYNKWHSSTGRDRTRRYIYTLMVAQLTIPMIVRTMTLGTHAGAHRPKVIIAHAACSQETAVTNCTVRSTQQAPRFIGAPTNHLEHF